jgi:hypothetical protein
MEHFGWLGNRRLKLSPKLGSVQLADAVPVHELFRLGDKIGISQHLRKGLP